MESKSMFQSGTFYGLAAFLIFGLTKTFNVDIGITEDKLVTTLTDLGMIVSGVYSAWRMRKATTVIK